MASASRQPLLNTASGELLCWLFLFSESVADACRLVATPFNEADFLTRMRKRGITRSR